MPDQGIESMTVINLGGYGGSGGPGHGKGGTGGRGGTGEGGKVDIDTVQNLTYVNQGQGLEEVLYKWLESPPDTKDRQYELLNLHHEGTGHWLLDDYQFIEWRDTPGSLWIRGISGTGKSVLSSTVITEITGPDRVVAYFYFDFRNERQRMDIMLRSIVWQLSGWSPSRYSFLEKLYKTLGNGTTLPQSKDLLGVLNDLLSELDQTYIIIDGLDECNKTDWKQLINFMHSLCQSAKKTLHLLFTSQPLQEFKTAFKDVISIELGSWVSNNDIRSFVGSKVHEVGNWASDDNYAWDVTQQIVQKSNGMFRMAACLLIELGRCHWKDDWEEALTALPADLFGIYSRFLAQATGSLKTVFVQAIFRWLLFSARQVTLDQLADAIAFRLDSPAFDFSDPKKSIYYPNRRQGNSEIFKLLEGLIVIKDNDNSLSTSDRDSLSSYEGGESSITLAHSSVMDYILSPQFQQQFSSFIDLRDDVSHKFITQTCVRYLLLFAEPKYLLTKDTVSDYPMAWYAGAYWAHHLQLCNNEDQKGLLPLTMSLLKDGSSQYTALYQLRPVPRYLSRVWDGSISPALCMCAEIGYTDGVRSLLVKQNTSADIATGDGWTALHVASRDGHLDIARLLIEHNAPVDLVEEDGWTALHLASRNGHLDIARLLIEHNAPVDLVNKDGWTALHLASSNGHLDIARLLIEHNVPVDLVQKDGWTALHLASRYGHLDIARLLTEHVPKVA